MEAPNSDEVVAVVEDVGGRTYDSRFDLFFTKTVIVAAVVLHPSDLAYAYAKTRRLEELVVGGLLHRHEIQVLSKNMEQKRRETFQGRAVEEILRIHRGNIEIAYKSILLVKISQSILGIKLVFNMVDNRRFEFRLSREQVVSVRRILRSLNIKNFTN